MAKALSSATPSTKTLSAIAASAHTTTIPAPYATLGVLGESYACYAVPIVKVSFVREYLASTASGAPASALGVPEMRSPSMVATFVAPLFVDADRESFWIVMLDVKNRPLAVNRVSTGALNTTIVAPREVFKPAVLAGAAAIIVAHNHPSGDATPSREDIEITRRLVEAGRILGVEVLDHIIIGEAICTGSDGRAMAMTMNSFKQLGLL